jgi:hypothetical protein
MPGRPFHLEKLWSRPGGRRSAGAGCHAEDSLSNKDYRRENKSQSGFSGLRGTALQLKIDVIKHPLRPSYTCLLPQNRLPRARSCTTYPSSKCGGIAQLVERLVRNEKAWGSNPHTSTTSKVAGNEIRYRPISLMGVLPVPY